MPIDIDEQPWLTTNQAAIQLKRSAQRVRQMCDTGLLKAQITPLGRLVLRESVDALILARTVSQQTDTHATPHRRQID
jgi:hypothetical protein